MAHFLHIQGVEFSMFISDSTTFVYSGIMDEHGRVCHEGEIMGSSRLYVWCIFAWIPQVCETHAHTCAHARII